MLVKIKHGRKMRITIPLALGAFQEVIESLEDLVWLYEKVFPGWNKNIKKLLQQSIASSIPIENFSLVLPFQLLKEVFYELRKHGRWQLAEIDIEDIKVKVEIF